MNHLKRIAFCLLLAPLFLMPNHTATTDPGHEQIAIEISLAGNTPLIVPILASGNRTAVIPVPEAKISAVKIVPKLERNSVRFEVLAVLDSLEGVASCEQLRALRTETVATYLGHKGDLIHVLALRRFGVPAFNVKVVSYEPDEEICQAGCCCCGPTRCCPATGKCFDCSICGLCCN